MDIESKTRRAILEGGMPIEIDGELYHIQPPTTATLIELSELSTHLPNVEGKESIIDFVFSNGDKGIWVCRMIAMMILGAKRVNEGRKAVEYKNESVKKWSWKHLKKVDKVVRVKNEVSEYDKLTRWVMNEMQPKELLDISAQLVADMQVADFFAVTASLKGINLTKRTKEEAVTQSGE